MNQYISVPRTISSSGDIEKENTADQFGLIAYSSRLKKIRAAPSGRARGADARQCKGKCHAVHPGNAICCQDPRRASGARLPKTMEFSTCWTTESS
jgi:hypothetical protein